MGSYETLKETLGEMSTGTLSMTLDRGVSKRFSQGLLGSSPSESPRESFKESPGQSLVDHPLERLFGSLLGSSRGNSPERPVQHSFERST